MRHICLYNFYKKDYVIINCNLNGKVLKKAIMIFAKKHSSYKNKSAWMQKQNYAFFSRN